MQAQNADDIARIVGAIPNVQRRVDVGLLRAYLEELLHWNPRLGLISKRETPTVAAAVIRRCIEMWDVLGGHLRDRSRETPRRIADIGSGAGFPGMIWKLLAPGVCVTLVERKRRRAFFLERVVARLGLTDVAVHGVDLKTLARKPSAREAYDLAAMLAVAPPQRLATDTERILQPGGFFVTTLASTDPAEALVGSSLHLQAQAPLSEGILAIYERG